MNLVLDVLDVVVNTLWQAVLIAFAVWLLLRLTPRINAATKCAIWWVTLVCVVILPFETQIFSSVKPEHKSAPALRSAAASQALDVWPSITGTTFLRIQPRPKAVWPRIVFSAWAAILLWQILRIIRSYLYLRGMKKRASSGPASLADIALPHLARPASVLLSHEITSPAAAGFLHPAILLPQPLLTNLSATELEHVVLHETAHLAGYDDWINLAVRTLGGALALHPVATWILRQIEREREVACDDWVVAKTGAAQPYAETLVHLMELREVHRSPVLSVGMFGNKSRIGSRIETLLATGRTLSARVSRLGVFVSAAALGMLLFAGSFTPRWIALAQDSVPEWQVKAGGKLSFEVASIKPAAPGAPFIPPNFPISNEERYAETGGRLTSDFPVTTYIEFAYKLWLTREQRQAMIAHLPKWVASESFVIEAKAPISNPTKDQMRLMMQSLLADRFQLALHFETKEVPVLALTLVKLGKTGPKLIPHAEGPPCDAPTSTDLFAPHCGSTFLTRRAGVYRSGSRNTTLDLLSAALPSFGNLDRPVVNRTGLEGRFDYRLDWTPEPNGSAPPNPDAPPSEFQESTFTQALREQLGLKLGSTKGPVQTLVIDHIERPSAN